MTEKHLKKIPFFQQLNLEAVTPVKDSSKIFRNNLSVLPSDNANLTLKNNSIKTGYENFFIKKGSLKLFPIKDFNFIGKQVACQKCYQLFTSRSSYKTHIGTSSCVKKKKEQNLIYIKIKEKNSKLVWKNHMKKAKEDFQDHDTKKNLLIPEMVNTLQTRNKVFSDNIIYQQNTIKENNNDESPVKRLKGSPRKNIVSKNVVPKKRGRPKKLNAVTVDSLSQNDNSSSSHLKIDESIPNEGKENINNIKITTSNETPNINHLNDIGFNHIFTPSLRCHMCCISFTSIPEFKLHRSEHLEKFNIKSYVCTICGIKFQQHSHLETHINVHNKTEKKKKLNKNNAKHLECKKCNRQYNYLRTYFAHIATHK